MKIRNLILPSIVLGSAILVTAPQESHGFATLGHSLNPNQSDFRVYNNFLDAQANNNTSQVSQFPGWDGAELAVWKGCVEWSSDPHGDGSGDPLQAELGSGDSNFDPMFSGAATSTGSIGDNVHSALDQSGGGVLAFMQGGGSGWWCRYYDSWTWYDGPGNNGYPDLQAVVAHEYGHSLGLGHSAFSSATMYGSGGSTGDRSLHSDDQAGIQAIYGHRDSTGLKVRILSAVNTGGIVHLVCENLTLNANQVWFTRLNPNLGNASGDPIKVTGLVSTNNNTELDVVIPIGAGPGDIMVKAGTGGQAGKSAPYPFDPFSVPAPIVSITSISNGTVEALTPTGGELLSLFGTNFANVFEVRVDGDVLGDGTSFDGSFTVVNDGQIDIQMPLADSAGLVDITVTGPGSSDQVQVDIVASSSPALAIDQPSVSSAVGLDIALSATPGDVIFLLFSPVLAPTTIPGVLDWEIGGGNLNLIFQVKGFTIGAKLWRKQGFGPFTGLTAGEVLHFEGWVLEAANAFASPWNSTNAASRMVID
jgi:hypothetical protein